MKYIEEITVEYLIYWYGWYHDNCPSLFSKIYLFYAKGLGAITIFNQQIYSDNTEKLVEIFLCSANLVQESGAWKKNFPFFYPNVGWLKEKKSGKFVWSWNLEKKVCSRQLLRLKMAATWCCFYRLNEKL